MNEKKPPSGEARKIAISPVRVGGLLEPIVLVLGHCVAQVDQKLRKASLSCGVISKDCRESCISERFWQTLTESLTCSIVVAESGIGMSVYVAGAGAEHNFTSRSTEQHA